MDDDSDAPVWAGGNTDANPHINRNEDSGTTRGGDYGDLYVLRRDLNGVPVLTTVDVDGDGIISDKEYFVQPVDADGNDILLDQYGEVPEGAPVIEVDFGRLNIVRSPESVLDQAFEEAMKVLTAEGAVISLDFCGRLTSTYTDPLTGETIVKTIDSPRENMAIYRNIMRNMFTNRLGFLGEDPNNFDPLQIAASCFAAGSDKTGTVIIDEVVYINGFLDCIGLNPILNEHEYDNDYDNKWYWNYGDYDGDGNQYRYNRDVYADRYIQFLVWGDTYYPVDENGVSESPYIFSIKRVMEGLVDGQERFTYQWKHGTQYETHVKGFALAIDDAVQVLEFIHGNSNILFLPNYVP